MNSKHFSNGRIDRLNVTEIPIDDVRALDLDANEADSVDGETIVQHIPLVLEYNTVEDWYWRYGEERLYKQFRPSKDGDASNQLSWLTLHRFITNYAWVEDRWRFILDKPCWPFHSDVVDQIVMLYLGRKHYEEHRSTAPPREHVEFLDMSQRLAKEVVQRLSYCEIKMNEKNDEHYQYIRHCCDEYVRSWIPSLMHRVLKIEGIKLPDSPVMDAARNAEYFAKFMTFEEERNSNLDHRA